MKFLVPLGPFDGVVDATGGGGGAHHRVLAPTAGRITPRQVVGSVSTSEFFVSISVSLGFLIELSGPMAKQAQIAIALLVGGALAAPVAPPGCGQIGALTGRAHPLATLLTGSAQQLEFRRRPLKRTNGYHRSGD